MPGPAMPTLKATRRPACPRCLRPQRTCLCAWVRRTDNHVPLLLLQHPLEVQQAKGSARLLQLSLRDCRCEVGESFDPDALATWLGEGAALLYPGPGATPGTAAPPLQQAPQRLVMLDGTWRQSRQLLRLNPLLQQVPRLALPEPPPSLYRIRQAQRPEQRSTLEAACLALGRLEDRPAHYAPLLLAFAAWVASVASVASLASLASLGLRPS